MMFAKINSDWPWAKEATSLMKKDIGNINYKSGSLENIQMQHTNEFGKNLEHEQIIKLCTHHRQS